MKARRAANPEKHRKRAKDYRHKWKEKNPDYMREYNRAWARAHPEIVKARQALAAGRRRAGFGQCSRQQWDARRTYYGGRCWIPGCTREGDQMDHIIALSRGGTNWPANLRPVCRRHNAGRKNMHWREYLARIAC